MGRRRPPKSHQTQQSARSGFVLPEVEALKREVSSQKRDIDDAKRDIADVRRELKDVVTRRRAMIGFVVVVVTFLGYTSWTGIKKIQERLLEEAEERLHEQVSRSYEEKNVDEMVGRLIEVRAEALIREEAAKEVEPIVAELREKQSESAQAVLEMKATQSYYAGLTEMTDLIVRAQNGDLPAWTKLVALAEAEQATARGKLATEAARRIYEEFFAEEFYRSRYYLTSVSNEEVVASLEHRFPHKRKMAVFTIEVRNMYAQVPVLIAMISKEQSLDVLGEIFRVLNQMLETNIHLADTDPQKRFSDAWEARRKALNLTEESGSQVRPDSAQEVSSFDDAVE